MESHYGHPGGGLELARSRGKGAGVAVALSLAAVTSVPARLLTVLYRQVKP